MELGSNNCLEIWKENKKMNLLKKVKYLLGAFAFLIMLSAFTTNASAATNLGKVTGLKQVDAQTGEVRFTFDPVLYPLASYEISVSTDGVNWVVQSDMAAHNPAGNYASGLSAGSTYYVRVRAYIQERDAVTGQYYVVYSEYSDPLEVVTKTNGSVSNLRKTKSTETSISLKWDPAQGANAYYVKYTQVATGKVQDKMVHGKNSLKLTGLDKNATYNIAVYAVRENANYAAQTSYFDEVNASVTPTKATGVSVTDYNKDNGDIAVSVDRNDCAAGFQAEVWTAYKKSDKKIATANSKSATIHITDEALKKSNFVKIRVRAYSFTTAGNETYGAWSAWVYTAPKTDVKLTKSAKKGITIKIGKVNGADRYVIYAGVGSYPSYKKIATTTKTSYTMTKLDKKSLQKYDYYHVYVVAQKKVGKKYVSCQYFEDQAAASLYYE